jgi:integrase
VKTTVPFGNVRIPIYRESWRDKKRSKQYHAHCVYWRDSQGRRCRAKFNTLARAKVKAGEVAAAIANGQISLLEFSQADKASHLRIKEIIAPFKIAPEAAAADWAAGRRLLAHLADPPSVADLTRFYLRNQPASAADKTSPEIVAEMIAARTRDGASANTLADYQSRLLRFAQAFPGSLAAVTSMDINQWLRGLTKIVQAKPSGETRSTRQASKIPISRRSRNNYRGNLVDLYRYARQSGYLPRDWDPLVEVAKAKNEPVRIEVFAPGELVQLLAHARPNLRPFICLGAWGGLRHEEMCCPRNQPALEWSDIDLEKGELHVRKEVARKIGRDRLWVIPGNLLAWLRDLAPVGARGRVCELANATNPLLQAAAAAGIKWKDNGLRKSFISYRYTLTKNIGQVADEAGTSPERIRANYKKLAREKDAKSWFDIWPTSADMLQIRFDGL